jgi:HEAT repeat protein
LNAKMFSTSLGIVFLCVLPLSQNQGQEVTPKETLIRLIEKLKSDDDSVAEAARHDLATLPKKDKEVAIPLIIKGLKDTSGDSRYGRVASCLDDMGLIAIPFLIEASTNDKNARVREVATYALGRCLYFLRANKEATEEESKAGVSALFKAMGDKSDRVRFEAAASFGSIYLATCDEAVPSLIHLVRSDPDRHVRNLAAAALGGFGAKPIRAIPALIGALKESLPEDEVYGTLGRTAARALARIGAPSVPALLEVFQSKKESLDARKEAAYALGQLNKQILRKGLIPTVLPVLTEALKDPDPSIRISTLQALIEFGQAAQKALPALEQLVKKDLPEVGVWGAEAMYFIDRKNRTSIPFLVQCLKQYQYRHLSLLGSLGDVHRANSLALPARLLSILEENHKQILVDLVCDALARIGPDAEAAVPILIELLADERENTNYEARNAIERIGKPAIPALIKASKNPNKRIAEEVAPILGRLR